jgi:hypothetical protein
VVVEQRTTTRKRRSIDHIRQDVASCARALRVHAELVGRLRAEGRGSHTAKLSNAADLKAEAEYCEELERTILKHFNAAVRKAAKGDA